MKKALRGKKRLAFVAIPAIILLVALIIFNIRLCGPESNSTLIYWPTQGWRNAAPEEQGFDSAKMAAALQSIRDSDMDIHSLLVIRNGMVITDAYFYPYDGRSPHDMESVTKSMMTTLIAIAAEQGKLQLDQPMVSFFPDRTIANLNERKKRITVRHLAGMTSSLQSMGFERDEGSLTEMEDSPDWIQWSLDRPVISEPGTEFVYDSPGMHLLSAILQKATGQTALEFARQNLLEPLGITEVMWMTDPQGFNDGWGHMYLYPRDAAKLGYLWLNCGTWEGRQIVPRAWVEDSVQRHMKTPTDDDYGYGWWVMNGNVGKEYAAIGRGGQRIHVMADLNLMVVTTGSGFEIDDLWPYLDGVLVDPEKPLPANPTGVEKMIAAIAAVAQPPAAQLVKPLPVMAHAITGKTYLLDDNPLQVKTLRMDFIGTDSATLYLTLADNQPFLPQPIGLDGIYRIILAEYNLPRGARGYWEDERTFICEYDEIAANNHLNLKLTFQGEQLQIEAKETDHDYGVTIQGKYPKNISSTTQLKTKSYQHSPA